MKWMKKWNYARIRRVVIFIAAGWSLGTATTWTVELGLGLKNAPDSTSVIMAWNVVLWAIAAVIWFLSSEAKDETEASAKRILAMVHQALEDNGYEGYTITEVKAHDGSDTDR